MKKVLFIVLVFVSIVLLVGCASDADVASQRISVAADNFEVSRRIVFYNGITNDYILVIEGLCSLGNFDVAGELSVTCKTSPTEYKKHYLGLSDNVTYFSEQVEPSSEDVFHYRIIFKPQAIIPDIEIKTK